MDLHLLGLFGGTASGFLLGAGLAFKLGRGVGEQRGFEAAKFAQSYGALGTPIGTPAIGGFQQAYQQGLQGQQGQLNPYHGTLIAAPNTWTNTYGLAPNLTGAAPGLAGASYVTVQSLGGGGGGGAVGGSNSALDYSALTAQAQYNKP